MLPATNEIAGVIDSLFFSARRGATGAVDAGVKSQKKYPPLVSQRGVPPREDRK